MTVRKSSDGTHFIIGVENVDDEIQKEKQHLKELKTEKELARRDELTGIKNKTAYKELEKSVQGNDFECRLELMEKLRGQVLENKRTGTGVVLASGMSEYRPESDNFVSDIFERADREMYEDKQRLKYD